MLTVVVSKYGVVDVNVESVVKLSGGDVDDEPFLSSQNTLGNRNCKLKFSSGKLVVVVEVGGGVVERSDGLRKKR